MCVLVSPDVYVWVAGLVPSPQSIVYWVTVSLPGSVIVPSVNVYVAPISTELGEPISEIVGLTLFTVTDPEAVCD